MAAREWTCSLRPRWRVCAGIGAVVFSILIGVFRLVALREPASRVLTSTLMRLVIERDDSRLCDALLQRGAWLDHQFRNWQPEGA
jgi:hypothetical protein